ncbi:MAG: hypothetical protein JW829_15335 [Pirellulales bacterium]|nr:hypothetical protein [Pirellulales bacterium]
MLSTAIEGGFVYGRFPWPIGANHTAKRPLGSKVQTSIPATVNAARLAAAQSAIAAKAKGNCCCCCSKK